MSTEYAKRVTPMGIPNTRLDDLPDLIDVQKKSFEWFLKEGLKEELLAFSPVKDWIKSGKNKNTENDSRLRRVLPQKS
jgi:DNA-directed RNA polymerase beta subunit